MADLEDSTVQPWLKSLIGSNAPIRHYPDVSINANEQIRILSLLPGRFDEELCCELSVLSLPAKPPRTPRKNLLDMAYEAGTSLLGKLIMNMPSFSTEYEALSYAWGTYDNHAWIRLNGEPQFPVTRNLWLALRRLRSPRQKRRLWVDQICINQRDLDERREQVRIMGRVYECASDVLVWLGDVDAGFVPDQRTRQAVWGRGGHAAALEKLSALQSAIESTTPPWWKRTWVIQEFVNARKEAVMHFGGYHMRWDEVQEFLARLIGTDSWYEIMDRASEDSTRTVAHSDRYRKGLFQRVFEELGNDRYPDALGLLIKTTDVLSELRSQAVWDERSEGRWKSLSHFADIIVGTDATDPRDKVYSLLSLISPTERRLIVPNYGEECTAVYTKATYASVEASGHLGVLRMISFRRQYRAQLPSWVVDFAFRGVETGEADPGPVEEKSGASNLARRLTAREGDRGPNYFLQEAPRRPWFRLQRTDTLPPVFDATAKTLTVEGWCFDQICFKLPIARQAVARRSTRYGVDESAVPSVCVDEEEIERSMRQLQMVSPYKVLRVNTSAGAEQTLTRQVDSRSIRDGISNIYRRSNSAGAHESVTTDAIFTAWRAMFGSDLEYINDKLEGLDEWLRHFDFVAGGAVIFMTASGFLGIGPESIAEHDALVLCCASAAPLILRPSGVGWELKGFAFVKGIMSRELVERVPGVELEAKRFVLV
ncbi:hypothetical protein LTR85_009755 [Meristemomyces frigidus]|nr:hypothetical protein LTR85_009755 [Meristemomyces frigidus]